MDELFVGKMYYVSDIDLVDAQFRRTVKMPGTLCKCTSKRGKFKIRDGVYRYMKYWVAEKEARMEKRIKDTVVAEYIASPWIGVNEGFALNLAKDLQDARKELEEAKKDSVWRDAPEDATFASVHHCVTSGQPYKPDVARFYYREVPKTPKQELIDKFAEKNALAMKCANLSKEILEAFVKEYEEIMK